MLIDKVIAKVGTETILLSDVEGQYSYALEQGSAADPSIKCDILQAIIGQKLVVHHAKLDSVEVSPDEIEASLDFRIDQVLRQMGGDETLFQEYYGMTVLDMRGKLREDLNQQMLAERMQGQILNSVSITPKEVKQFFNSIPSDSIPFLSAEVELSEVVVKPQVNAEENAKALKKILEIRKRIVEGGEDFAELARTFSDDPGSGAQGGNLGFASRGTFVPEFEAAAYTLTKEEISEPIETEFGFHILQLLERRGNKVNIRHILVKPEITEADLQLARTKLDTVRAQIERGKISFENAVKLHSEESLPSYSNNGMIQNPQTGKTSFETAQLPSEIYFAIEDLVPGDITEPLEYPLPTGETYYRIIKVRDLTNPHKASLEEDYAKIQRFAKESKKNEYFSTWLEEKFASTFIAIEPGYLSCPELDMRMNK
jgi:peptidyl-prolyl cis-trans isomerase SurA